MEVAGTRVVQPATSCQQPGLLPVRSILNFALVGVEALQTSTESSKKLATSVNELASFTRALTSFEEIVTRTGHRDYAYMPVSVASILLGWLRLS